MKVIIQIPCYNEEATLPIALSDLPRELPGVSEVEWLVIDDGSTDKTAQVASDLGVDHIVRFSQNQGLAKAFMAGLDACLRSGADIIVNTDADNQYCAADIPKLVAPIVEGKAEIVVGARPIDETSHFSPAKKALQKFGSWVVRKLSGTDVPDAPSGFRAISRQAATQLNVFNSYSYTLETIIQAGQKRIPITSVPIRTNESLRPSRLMKSMRSYITRSMLTILRIFVVYRPFRTFVLLGALPFLAGAALVARWLFLHVFFYDVTRSRTPSLVAAAILMLIGVQLWIVGLVADLLSTNRRLMEDVQVRVRRLDAQSSDSEAGVRRMATAGRKDDQATEDSGADA